MKKIAALFMIGVILGGSVTPALAWGNKGHQTVGKIAELFLKDRPAMQKIKGILLENESLADIATWPDKIRNREVDSDVTDPDPDTEDFLTNSVNRKNKKWHFVDLPLDCKAYDDADCKKFTSDRDIVHKINLCIARLRGENVPGLTPRNALRWLVHLVGDLHQPLHVGVGFIKEDLETNKFEIVRSPVFILDHHLTGDSDIGGNRLVFSNSEDDNLHSFWDTATVNAISGSQSVFSFAKALKTEDPSWKGNGPVTTWASQWASDTLTVSRVKAYNTIRIKKPVILGDDPEDSPHYLIERGSTYVGDSNSAVKTQLAKAGFRLAQLLEAIL